MMFSFNYQLLLQPHRRENSVESSSDLWLVKDDGLRRQQLVWQNFRIKEGDGRGGKGFQGNYKVGPKASYTWCEMGPP